MTRDVCEHFNPVDLPCAKCEEKRKSEALFLADELEIPLGTVIGSEVHRRAAAELRRLHADAEESEALRERLSELLRNTAIALRGPEPELTRWSWHDLPELATALKAQRDALLEALKELMVAADGVNAGPQTWLTRARAAIKAAEEKNKYE